MSDPVTDTLVALWREAKATRDEAAATLYRAEAALIEAIHSHDPDGERYQHHDPDTGETTNLKVRRDDRLEVNEELLERRLPRSRWNEITTRRVDREAWHAAVKLQRIPKDIVRQAETRHPKKPWIQQTPVKAPVASVA